MDVYERTLYNGVEKPSGTSRGLSVMAKAGKSIRHGDREWLTTQEAMAVLGIGRTRLWRLTKDGPLVAHQRGPDRRARYYAREEVERLAREYRPVPMQPSRPKEA